MKEKTKPIESDNEWEKICRIWAIKQGYDRDVQSEFTLSQWLSLSPETLRQWKALKLSCLILKPSLLLLILLIGNALNSSISTGREH